MGERVFEIHPASTARGQVFREALITLPQLKAHMELHLRFERKSMRVLADRIVLTLWDSLAVVSIFQTRKLSRGEN